MKDFAFLQPCKPIPPLHDANCKITRSAKPSGGGGPDIVDQAVGPKVHNAFAVRWMQSALP